MRTRRRPAPAREDEPRADQARPGAPGQDRPTREDRARAEPRAGHRREHDAREQDPEARQRPRRTITERKRDAIADVGLYRAVSYTDLSERHFDGHPYATRRSVNYMIRAGLIEEHEATGPQGHTFTVLTATERGRDAAQRAAVDAGHVPEQQTWTGLVKPAELSHDTAVYRAALDERARIEAEGGRVTRVRIDAELKATSPPRPRRRAPRAATARRTRRSSQPRTTSGCTSSITTRCCIPTRSSRLRTPTDVSGRVNVEMVSDHYHAAAIAAKAGAGYAMHGSSRSATRKIARALARETDAGRGGGPSQPGRDGSVEL